MRPKTCSYLADTNDENNKAKDKPKFETYKYCLEATPLKILKKSTRKKLIWIVLEKNHKEFIKINIEITAKI